MCKMWERIRYGVKWRPNERLALAFRGLNMETVDSVKFSFDPFFDGNRSLREFWFSICAPRVRLTNPKLKVIAEVRNDRQPPFFLANLVDGRRLLFKTNGMKTEDLTMCFNRLLGNPELGKSGLRPRPTPR
ncbi:hypothetical protein AB6A40_007474 [Gnathostoma spinigerum]|uniref:Large ribosomal subunit protein mL53 n=1 Tax=Gnathostoma spinigerum TaxID=75299 RepID=A0ABD6ELC0_9BILA